MDVLLKLRTMRSLEDQIARSDTVGEQHDALEQQYARLRHDVFDAVDHPPSVADHDHAGEVDSALTAG